MRDIDAFYRKLSRDERLSPSTIRPIHNVLTGSLDQAVRWGWRSGQPRPVGQTSVRPPVRHPSSALADVMAAIARADQEFATFLRLAAVIGGRRGEVGALRWSSIDLDAGQLVITKALIETRDRTILEKDTKTHQARRVALDAGTVAALGEWRSQVDRRAESCGVEATGDGFVFSPEPDGSRPWRPFRWTSSWRHLRERAGSTPRFDCTTSGTSPPPGCSTPACPSDPQSDDPGAPGRRRNQPAQAGHQQPHSRCLTQELVTVSSL